MTANIISAVTLPQEIFLTEKFLPKRINIIYGRNGTGKSTIANLFYHTDRLTFGDNISDTECKFFIFDKKFIDNNIQNYSGMPGIVTISTQNAELIRELNELKRQLQNKETDIQILTDIISLLDKEYSDFEEQFREICWKKTKELRKEFEKALTNKKQNRNLQMLVSVFLRSNIIKHNCHSFIIQSLFLK